MTPALRTLAAALLGASLVSAAHAQATFGGLTLQSGTIAAPAYDLATIDFDSDGDLDIVYIGNTHVNLLRNDRSGTLTPAGLFILTVPGGGNAGGTITRIAVGDVNGDGLTDVVLASSFGVYACLRTGPSTFGALMTIGALTGGNAGDNYIALGDIDGDGDLDIAACRSTANIVRVFRNNGGMTFAATDLALNAPYSLSLGDLDGDGDADLVATSGLGPSFLRFYESQQGVLAPRTDLTWASSSYVFHRIRLADIDGDSDLDVALVVNGGFGANYDAYAVRNQGAFAFQYFPSGYRLDPNRTQDIALADLEGDGDLDMLVACVGGGTLRYGLYANNAYPTTATVVPGLTDQLGVRSMVTLDLDGNSSPDVVMTFGANGGGGRWWLNQTDILPPTAFSLLSPANNTSRLPLPGEPAWGAPAGALAWQRAVAFTVAYTVQIASDEQFLTVVWSGPSAGPTATVPSGVLLENTRYWWRVTATSQGGSTTSPAFTFTTRAFADGNLDGIINFTDLNNTLSRFGQSLP